MSDPVARVEEVEVDDPATVHLAARSADGRVAGVVRLSPAP